MKRIVFTALSLFLLRGAAPVQATNKLLIERVEPDWEQESLFLHGRYFGSERPKVWLDYAALEVPVGTTSSSRPCCQRARLQALID